MQLFAHQGEARRYRLDKEFPYPTNNSKGAIASIFKTGIGRQMPGRATLWMGRPGRSVRYAYPRNRRRGMLADEKQTDRCWFVGITIRVIRMGTTPQSNRRLHPSVFDSDYYSLVRLRSSLVRIIERYLPEKIKVAIFDYGCGDVPYRTLFDGIANPYIAGDISGNPDADMVLDPSGCVPCEDEAFDVVLSIQALEHVPDVSVYLTEARRLLRQSGLMILATHGWWTHHPYPHDYWRWTREGLTTILNAHQFEVIEVYWIIGMLAYSCQLRAQCWKGVLENRGVLGRLLLRVISFTYQKLMHIADKITPDHVGQSNAAIYVMVVRKVS